MREKMIGYANKKRKHLRQAADDQHQYNRFVLTYNIVLLIPLLIISFSVGTLFQRQELDKVNAEVKTSLERQISYWTQQTSVIRVFNSSCKYDKKYNSDYSDKPISYLDIFDDFSKKQQSFPFVDSIYLYDIQDQLIISSAGKYTPDQFFSAICRMDVSVFDEPMQDSVLYAYPASLKADSKTGIVFISPINTWGVDGNELKYLLYTVRSGKMNSQFGQTVENGFTVLLFGGNVLYSSHPFSQDESLEAQYQALLTADEYYTYSEVLEGDFSITLFIPKESLTEGSRIYLQGFGYWFVCSLLVGSLLAFYFSKKHHLAFKQLLDHKANLTSERDSSRRESCLYELLTRTMCENDSLYERCLKYEIFLDRHYKFFIVSSENLAGLLDRPSLAFYRIELMENVFIYLVCTDEDMGTLREFLRELTGHHLGLGSLITDVRFLHQSYQEALREFRNPSSEYSYPYQTMSALKTAIRNNEFLKGSLILDEIGTLAENMDEISLMGILWDIVWIFQLDPTATLEFVKNTEGGTREKVLQFIQQTKAQINEEPPEERPVNYKKRSIEEILAYVDEHYLEDNFSVKYMAYYFDTSISNISHFFKKNTGMTISQYVEQIKIENAKTLLRETDKRVADIAASLRYANSTVFIEMFKKNENMTPGNYREKFRSGVLEEDK